MNNIILLFLYEIFQAIEFSKVTSTEQRNIFVFPVLLHLYNQVMIEKRRRQSCVGQLIFYKIIHVYILLLLEIAQWFRTPLLAGFS